MKLNLSKQGLFLAVCSLMLANSALPQQQPPVAGSVTIGVAVANMNVVANGWRASKLMHAHVYNDANQKIGRIGDLIIAPDGTLSVAIIDVGGFLGMGTHHVAIPVQQFSQVTPKIGLPGASKEALKQLPEFTYSKG